MAPRDLQITIDPHTLERALERGATKEEIEDVLRTGIPFAAKGDRLGKAKIFPFHSQWNKKFYEQKRIEVIYVLEQDAMITVTVYVFFGSWEEPS
jgi:hypothetical protein